MQSTSQPDRLPKPFAADAGGSYVRSIPTNSQVGVTGGAASLTDGFPPLTMTSLATGGIPPFGQDMNGILKWVTTINQWFQAGGPTIYDTAFATAIGGYPKGAVLQSATLGGGFWRSTAENNTTDPDAGGAGWASLFAPVFANPTFTGTLTSAGAAVFNSTVGLGAQAVAGTQLVNDNSGKVANTAYADRAATNAYNSAVAAADAYADAMDAVTLAAARQGRAQSTATVVTAVPGGVNGLTAIVTAPCNGSVLVVASMCPATTMVGGGSSFRILKNGVDVEGFHSTGAISTNYTFGMTAGQTVTIDGQNTMDGGTSAVSIGIALSVLFVPGP